MTDYCQRPLYSTVFQVNLHMSLKRQCWLFIDSESDKECCSCCAFNSGRLTMAHLRQGP